MKVLILGANGLIGQQFARLCREKGIDYVGTRYSRERQGLIPFNRLQFEKIPLVFDRISPTVVIDCIGLAGGVNFCEKNPAAGRKYHVEATKIMVDWCCRKDVIFFYVSTDCVFDGKNPPYKEEDKTNPLNSYGQLKLEGEQYIKKRLERYVIARTTNVFGWDPLTRTPNFLMHVINKLNESNTIKVPGFLYGNPTYAGDLAAGVMDLIEKGNFGLFHIVGPSCINRYDWAVKCIKMAEIKGKSVEKMEHPPTGMVPRPLLSQLDTAKFRKVSRVKLHDVEEGLRLFVDEMKQGLRHNYNFA